MGTANTRLAIADKGLVLSEATFLGVNTKLKEYLFFGDEAKTIVGKTPEFIKILRPVVSGVISDFDGQVALINKFVERAVYPYLKSYVFIRPKMRCVVAVPYISTEIERKAVEEVAAKTGFSNCYLIEKSIANAYSLKINIFSHHPVLLADMGGGLIEISILSGGGVVAQKTLKNAGDSFNHVVANYLYLKYGVILGESTCEQLKIKLLDFGSAEESLTVRGKSLENGLPKSVRVKSSDIKEALLSNFSQIIDAIKEIIELAPPEVVDEIYDRGVILTGELARVPNIDTFFSKELKIDTVASQDFGNSTIYGLLKICKNEADLIRVSIPKI